VFIAFEPENRPLTIVETVRDSTIGYTSKTTLRRRNRNGWIKPHTLPIGLSPFITISRNVGLDPLVADIYLLKATD
jgi:hypothetical protein